MAQIDFTNATIEPNGNQAYIFHYANFWTLLNNASSTTMELHSALDMTTIISNANVIVYERTGTKYSLIFSGTMTYVPHGTETSFCIATSNNSYPWIIKNISFVTGDTYSFQVDFDITIS